ncbi:molybdenum cofactor guanylyltransferase [Chloroflexota bacterium]
MSCIVLVGGKGLRLGRDKTQETIGSKTLLQRVVSRIGFINSDIIIVTGSREQSLPCAAGYPELKIVTDIYPEKGPLGGVYTGLAMSDSLYNVVVACDMPFLNQALLEYMVRVASGFEVVVPRLGRMIEPLHAVYSRGCLDHIEHLFNRNELRMRALFDMVKVRYVEESEIDLFDPKHLSFFNINNEADMRKAMGLAKNDDDKC